MGSPTTKTNYHEADTSRNRRSRPASRRRTPLRWPRRERGAPRPLRPGPGGAEFGLRRAGPGQGSGNHQGGGAPEGGNGAGTSPSNRFYTPRGPRVPTHLARPLAPCAGITRPPSLNLHLRGSQSLRPALSSPFIPPSPSYRPAPGSPSGSPDAPTPAGRGPGTAGPGASGRRGKRQRGGRPSRGVCGRRGSPRTSLSAGPTPLPPGSNLPASLAPTPLPTELLKFETCSPSPRTGSARGSRDSPPGCGRRCPVPGGSRLRERRRRTRRAGGRSGDWAAARSGL